MNSFVMECQAARLVSIKSSGITSTDLKADLANVSCCSENYTTYACGTQRCE